MNDTLTTIANYLFGWTVITLVLSWLLSFAYPIFRRITDRTSALIASPLILAYALLAPATATIALILLSDPELSFILISNHCHDGHCGPHVLHIATATLTGSVFFRLALALLAIVILWMAYQLRSSRRQLRMLESLVDTQTMDYHIVDSPQVIAWCAGLWSPKVYISKGLLLALNEEQLKQVLAHEFTHASRRDNLRKWVLHWVTIIWLPALRQRIRTDFNNVNEQISDLAATLGKNAGRDIDLLINTIVSCCGSKDQHSAEMEEQDRRISALKRELAIPSHHWFTQIVLLLTMSSVWLMLIISSIHFGHPLLEWLSQ